tara:strand:+ start:58 stop:684 length:627 start_codon:yes stop_codon:yes gene_type:complete
MLQPPKGKKKKANGSSSYGQISSSQEQRAESTNTAAKNFLSKAGKVAVDVVVESSGLGLGKRVLGAVKNMASSGRTSNQESAKEAVLGASTSIRSKRKDQSRPSQHLRPKTKTKSSQPSPSQRLQQKYKKVEEAFSRANKTGIKPGSATASPKGRIGNRMDRTVNEIKPTGLSPIKGNAKEVLNGMPMMGKPKEGISMRIKSRLGLGQ